MSDETRCYLCQEPDGKGEKEIRPYGPDGQPVCHSCAMRTPESKEEAKRQFGLRLTRAEIGSPAGVAMIGDGNGPLPFPGKRKRAPR